MKKKELVLMPLSTPANKFQGIILTIGILIMILVCPTILVAQSITIQAFGSSQINNGDKKSGRLNALTAARWNAAKDILTRQIGKKVVEDEKILMPLKDAFLKNPFDYILAEFVTSEIANGDTYQIQVSIKFNERKLVEDANKILSKWSGAAVKPRVMLLLEDKTDGVFSNAMSEEFNMRGLFEIKDRDTLKGIVTDNIQKKIDSGTLSLEDIDAMQNDKLINRELDYILFGKVSTEEKNGDSGSCTLTVSGLRVVDLVSAQLIATTTDSFMGTGSKSEAMVNAAVKAAKVLGPRTIDQLVARWNDLTQITLEIDGFTWFSKEGRDFYNVLKSCTKCRGNMLRKEGTKKNSCVGQLAYKGDLYDFAGELEDLQKAKSTGAGVLSVSDVDVSAKSVRLSGSKP